jgi:drug/metabolite transporter (DMT)-like permease
LVESRVLKNDITSRATPLAGSAYMAAAALTMALVGTSVKWATEGLSPFVVVFFRNFFGLLALAPWLLRPGAVSLRTPRWPLHLLRGTFGLGAMYCYFFAISRMNLAEAVMLNFTSPLFIPLIARLWLKEPLTKRVGLASLLGFAGVGLIERPGAGLYTVAAVFALLSAVFASAALVAVRKLGSTEPASRTAFYFTFIGAVATAFPLPMVWALPRAHQWVPLVATGAFASLAQVLLSKGYALSPAGIAATFHYLTVPVAALLGWAIWGESITWMTGLGGLLICSAGILVSLPARSGSREQEKSGSGNCGEPRINAD